LTRSRVAAVALCSALSFSTANLIAATAFTQPASTQAPAASSLDALSGEYVDPNEPDVPLSFYVKDGKLVIESDRLVPTALNQRSPTDFAVPETKITVKFALDSSGRGATMVASNDPESVYKRTGDPIHHVFHDYQRSEIMIPMRDGIKLHTIILKPSDISTPLPFLIQRTPYGVDGLNRMSFFGGRPELARDGYIYVEQDIRGRFKSEGNFVMSRPEEDHKNSKAVDESTDAYDTVDWLLKNIPGNNGRAGFLGTSYPGFLAMAAGIDPHPAVKAISPQAP